MPTRRKSAQDGLLATTLLGRLFQSGQQENLTNPNRKVNDAKMAWLADEGGLTEVPGVLLDQTTKSVAGRALLAIYRRHFEIIQADTAELRDLAYLLRYQVYVHEHGFEKPEDHPGERERDEFDEKSLHVLMRHRRSGIVVGTARLVLPDSDNPSHSFPIQTISSHPMVQDPEIAAHAVEFSRLAISRERLKRCLVGSGGKSGLLSKALATQIFPYLSVGLIAGVMEVAAANGYPIMMAVMEPFLIRNLSQIGIEIPFTDAPVEYHGLRVPCVLPSLHDTCAVMKKHDRASWEIVTNRGRTQELALIAQTQTERARRAVARAHRVVRKPAPVVLRAPGVPARRKARFDNVDSRVGRRRATRQRRLRQLSIA